VKSIEVYQNIVKRRIPKHLNSAAGERRQEQLEADARRTTQRRKSGIPVTNAKLGPNSRVLPSIGVPEVKRE
jgi:hypothetical protein